MILFIAIIALIFLILGTIIIKKINLKDSTKKIIIIFITIICLVFVAGIIVLLFKSRNINSKENTIRKDWIMKIELVDEERYGNKIYIYKDNTMIVEYINLYPNKVEKIDSNIDLDEVYEYIENSDYTSDSDYKVILNSGKNKMTKYISLDFEEIKDFIELIDKEEDIMNQPKGF